MSFTLSLAPASSKFCTISPWPFSAANIRAVLLIHCTSFPCGFGRSEALGAQPHMVDHSGDRSHFLRNLSIVFFTSLFLSASRSTSWLKAIVRHVTFVFSPEGAQLVLRWRLVLLFPEGAPNRHIELGPWS
jgi:hypothetical protein